MADGGSTSATKVLLGIPGLEGAVEIGRGGFGTVYRALQPEFRRQVAVKVLRNPVDDDRVRRRFERECQAMGAVSGHPSIVNVYQGGLTAAGRPYLVLDYMTGGSLIDRLRSTGRLPWQEVADIAVKLAGGLETAHRAGVLHRDIKPENILVSAYGEPKLADFGIARITGAETKTTALTATIAHAAPELFEDVPSSVQSDLYSLGSTLFTLLAGRLAFTRAGDEVLLALVARIGNDPVPDIRLDGVPDPICQVVERLMAKRAEDRFPSAEAVGRQMQRLQADAGLPVTPLTLDSSTAGRLESPTAVLHPTAPASTVPYHPPQPQPRRPPQAQPRQPQPPAAPAPAAAPRAQRRRLTLVLAGVVGLSLAAGITAAVVGRGPAGMPAAQDASEAALGEAALLLPDAVEATSTARPGADADGREIVYEPEQLTDHDPATAWRTPGDGVGEQLRLSFPQPVRISRIGLIPGYAKIDAADDTDRFRQNRTVESVRYLFDDGSVITAEFLDRPVLQFTDLDIVTRTVTVEIVATSEHGGRDFTAVSEIEVYGFQE